MKKINSFALLVVVLVAVFVVAAYASYSFFRAEPIRNFSYERDYEKVYTLFHKDDNWYWMISDYSRKHGFDLEFMMKHQSSSQRIKQNDLVTKVAEIDERIAGLVSYYPHSPHTWQFLFLLIDQDFRGQGLAKKMLKFAVDDMVRRGAIKIDLVTRVDNARAQGLYKKFGFKKTGQTEEHVYMSWYKYT